MWQLTIKSSERVIKKQLFNADIQTPPIPRIGERVIIKDGSSDIVGDVTLVTFAYLDGYLAMPDVIVQIEESGTYKNRKNKGREKL